MVDIDYSASHLNILANLIGYDCKDENIHIHIGKLLLEKDTISDEEYKEIKAALKRHTVKEVAIDFKRVYSTIYNIAKETKCGQNQL